MKKFFILTVISILCLSLLTACGPGAAPPDFTPFWGQLEKETELGEEKYLEKSEYKISVRELDENDKKDETGYKLDPTSHGIYTTTLTHVSWDGPVSTYKLENYYTFNGQYIKDGSPSETIEDYYESSVTFELTALRFTTLSSKKTVGNQTFIHTDKDKNQTIKKVSYIVTNTYVNNKVTSVLEYGSEFAEIFEETKDTITKSLGSSYFDNESLFLGIRSRTPDSSFSLSYNIFNPIDQTVSGMQAAYVAQEVDKETNKVKPVKLAELIKFNETIKPSITGTETAEVDCNLIQAKVNGNNPGAPINLYYAKNYWANFLDKSSKDSKDEDNKIYHEAPYYFLVKVDHGDLIYTLNTFDNKAQKKI